MPEAQPPARGRRPPGPPWLGTAVLVIAVLEVLLGVVSLALGAVVPGLLMLSSGLIIATLSFGLRAGR